MTSQLQHLASEIATRIIEQVTYPDRWLDIKRACQYSSMSKNTLMQYVLSGEIKASKKGGKWVVDRLSIDNFYQTDNVSLLFNDVAERLGL